MIVRLSATALLLAVVGAAAAPLGCEHAKAPPNWGTSDRHEPAEAERAAERERNPTADVRPGQPRTAMIVVTLVMVVNAIITIAVIVALEASRRTAQRGDTLQQAITARLRRDPRVSGARIVPTPRAALWRGHVDLEVGGTVSSERERRRVLDIAREEASAAPMRVRLIDALRVEPAVRRDVG